MPTIFEKIQSGAKHFEKMANNSIRQVPKLFMKAAPYIDKAGAIATFAGMPEVGLPMQVAGKIGTLGGEIADARAAKKRGEAGEAARGLERKRRIQVEPQNSYF